MLREAGPQSGSIERLAREAPGDCDVIVAAGGDGTVNAVANGLAGTNRPLAVLPLGTVNLVAHEIGLPGDPQALAEVIATGAACPIWPGTVGERLFLAVASAGVDAATVAAVDPAIKRRIGRLAFVWPALMQIRLFAGCQLTVEVEGSVHRTAFALIARGRFYAGRFLLARAADLEKPELHVMLLPRSDPSALLRYMAALWRGRFAEVPDLTRIICRRVRIAANRPVPVQADGESVGFLPIELGIAASPLMLIRPGRQPV